MVGYLVVLQVWLVMLAMGVVARAGARPGDQQQHQVGETEDRSQFWEAVAEARSGRQQAVREERKQREEEKDGNGVKDENQFSQFQVPAANWAAEDRVFLLQKFLLNQALNTRHPPPAEAEPETPKERKVML